MQSSKPLPSCSVELRFREVAGYLDDNTRVELQVIIDNKVTHTEVFHRSSLFLSCEPAVRNAVRQAIQRL